MQATAEISLYPLSEDYKDVIIDFILKLRRHSGLRVETNGMSTQIFGEYDALMTAIAAEGKQVFESGKAVLLIKLTGTDQSMETLPDSLR